ncbi:hypothetical protein ScPMuIL_014339 [Solemya velum]
MISVAAKMVLLLLLVDVIAEAKLSESCQGVYNKCMSQKKARATRCEKQKLACVIRYCVKQSMRSSNVMQARADCFKEQVNCRSNKSTIHH